MDSREYIFIYALKTNSDIPNDYPREYRNTPFETGVFLPQDDSNWFSRPPKYPARLFLLTGRLLHIIPHPTSAEPPAEIKLDDLIQIEAGSALLRGWLRFTTADRVQEIIYNTRASRPLEDFLVKLKRRWLPNLQFLPKRPIESYGDQLDIKFRNSVHFELDHDEFVIVRYFQAPVRADKRFLLLKRENWRPGNVLLLTSMNRLVWITDEYKRRRELYSSISFSVPLQYLQNCILESSPEGEQRIAMQFISHLEWYITIFCDPEVCSAFCHQINQTSENVRRFDISSRTTRN